MDQGIRFSFILSVVLGCNMANAGEVRIYNWEEYLSDDVIRQFELETGHTVKQLYFESENLRDEVVSSGRAEAYDLFIMDSYTLQVFGNNGYLNKIVPSQLPNLKHVNDRAREACKDYGIPYAWGTMGIGYRAGKVETPPDSWRDLFEFAKKNPGRTVIPLDALDTTAVALFALGYKPFTTERSEIKAAFELLNETKANLIDFRTALGYSLEAEAQSEMDMAVLYSGESYTVAEATGQDDWVYTIPEEGTLLWYECFASVAGKPHSPATQAFLNFINRPDISAQNAEEMWLATTNESAVDAASAEYKQDKELFPSAKRITDSFAYPVMDEESLRLRSRIIGVLAK